MAPPAEFTFNLDGLYFGFVLFTFLFGISMVQVLVYIRNNKDGWPLHLLVTVLGLLNIAALCLLCQILRYYTVSTVENLAAARRITTFFKIDIMITIIIIFLVELFFAVQLYLFNRNCRWLPGTIIALASGFLGLGILFISIQPKEDTIAEWDSEAIKIEIGLCQALITVSDITATIAMCWNFSIARSGIQEIKRSNTMIVLRKLLFYFLSRGLLVTAVQVASLAIFFIYPAWLPPHICMGSLYIITTLAMLNSRTSLRSHLYDSQIDICFVTAASMAANGSSSNT